MGGGGSGLRVGGRKGGGRLLVTSTLVHGDRHFEPLGDRAAKGATAGPDSGHGTQCCSAVHITLKCDTPEHWLGLPSGLFLLSG